MFCRKSSLLWVFCLVALLACGCGSAATVSGTVTVDGDALEEGDVAFHPVEEGVVAHAKIEGGRYKLMAGNKSAIAPGEYVVVVVRTTPPTSDGAVPRLLTPEKYANKETSDLKFTVTPGKNTIDLPLKSK